MKKMAWYRRKIRTDQDLLESVLDFAHEPIDEKSGSHLACLLSSAQICGYSYDPADLYETVEERKKMDRTERAIQIRQGIRDFLKTYVSKGFAYVDFEGQIRLGTDRFDMQPIGFTFYDQSENGLNGLCAIFAILVKSCGVKTIRVCPDCGKFFPVIRSRKRRFCSDDCRYKFHENVMSDEEKESRRKLRRRKYKDEKLNGGKK